MATEQPVSIAGAGPAGLTAAIHLARAGRQVVVHEQHQDVGRRFNEDFQALENWTSSEDILDTLRRIGIHTDFYCRPIHRVTSFGPRSATVVNCAQPIAYLIRRGGMSGSLDASLKQQALDHGVRLRFGSCLKETDADIVATGPQRARAVAVGIVFETNAREHAAVLLDDAVAPKGYAYLLTADGRGTLAVVLYTQYNHGKAGLEIAITRFTTLLGVEIRHPRYFGGYGDFDLLRSNTAGHRRYVGEAAGFQDLLFGFGIRYAVVSGYLAARSLNDGAEYDRLCRRDFGRQLRTSLINRYWYNLLGSRGYDLLVRASGWTREPKRFWTKVYTKPCIRMIAYPVARRCLSPPPSR
jgi:flavin-dependent dehydrogenase